METKRKIQLTAAVVIANAVGVLGATSPTIALANPCAPFGAFIGGMCPPNPAALCQQIAPPGCTVTGSACLPAGPNGYLICRYD